MGGNSRSGLERAGGVAARAHRARREEGAPALGECSSLRRWPGGGEDDGAGGMNICSRP